MLSIGDEIRKLRKQAHLTQEKLAERMRCDVKTVQNMEKGRPVSPEKAEAAAHIFGVPVSQITREEPIADPGQVYEIVKVLDLRSCRASMGSKRGREGRQLVTVAVWHCFTRRPACGLITFHAATSGDGVDMRCISPKCKWNTRCLPASDDIHRRGHRLEIDVTNVAADEKFEIEYHITYTNAFVRRDQWWFHTHVEFDATRLTLLVLYPSLRTCRSVSGKVKSESNPVAALRPTDVTPVRLLDNQIVLWQIAHPRRGETYQVDWEW
jgi:transcriptional regulator with XRE-family HTH domain